MRYLNPEPRKPDADYDIVDGVILDGVDLRENSREYHALTRFHRATKEERLAEERAWASQSGPVYIVRPATEHEHTVHYETADYPDRSGRVTVTEHCACGEVMGTYTDNIL